jgi:Ca-activated chloride channel family protein
LKKLSLFVFVSIFYINVQAQLVFQNIEHDYGKVDKAKSLLSEFVVTNTGTEDAVILRIDAGGNLAFKLDQIIIKPGKSDTLRLFLKPTKSGKFNEEISVFLSSQDKPIVLKVKGELKELDKDPMGTCFSFRESHPDVYKALAITDQSIFIVDKLNDKPIDGAFVQLFNANNQSYFQYTKNEGVVKLTVQPNIYDIQVRADFYKSNKSEQYLAKDGKITIKLERMDDFVEKDTTIKIAVILPVQVITKDTIIPEIKVVVVDTVSKGIIPKVKVVVDTFIPPPPPKPEIVNGELNPEVYVPSNIVFLIDLSSSMNEPAKLPLLKKSMKTLIGTMRSIDKITVVVYAESSRVLLPTTEVIYKDSIYKMIDGLKASGLTAANKALRTAYEINSKSFISGGNNQIILATDGMFNLSKADEDMMLNYAKSLNKIILSVVAFGNSVNAKSKLSSMAQNGKGDYLDIANETEAQEALLNEIKSKSKR